MNHIDSAIKARGANRKLVKTFGASKLVPGTYDDIDLSDAFSTGKIYPEMTRRPERDLSTSDLSADGTFVEYYFQLPDEQPNETVDFGDLMYTAYMYSLYENIEHNIGLETVDGMPGQVAAVGSTFLRMNLAGAFRSPKLSKAGNYHPMLRMRRCIKNGTVTFTVF